MSVDSRQLELFADNLQRAQRSFPELMKQLVVGEGVKAVAEAKRICRDEDIIDTGNLRNSFHTDPAPQVNGTRVSIDVHNSAEYASHVEYGHLVVRRGGGSLRERRRAAMSGGRFVRGKYMLTRAVECTKASQPGRINRKLAQYLRQMFEGGRQT